MAAFSLDYSYISYLSLSTKYRRANGKSLYIDPAMPLSQLHRQAINLPRSWLAICAWDLRRHKDSSVQDCIVYKRPVVALQE